MTDRISFYKVPDAFVSIEGAIEDSINEETGEVTCDITTLMERDDILSRADEGIEWYAKQDRNLTAQMEAIKQQTDEVKAQIEEIIKPYMQEIDILTLAMRARRNRKDFNKWLVAELLKVLGEDHLVLSTGKKVWTKTTESVEVSDNVDLSTWPVDLVRVKREPDKKALKEAAKSGEWSMPGVEIVTKKSIQFPR